MERPELPRTRHTTLDGHDIDDGDAALIEVRDDLRRQINDATTRTAPRNSRQRRTTIPIPAPHIRTLRDG